MPRSTYLWLLKCLGLCLVGFIALGLIGRSFTALISWTVYHDNPTPRLRNAFAMRYYLPLCVTYGFLLGLIPLHKIREAFQSSLGLLFARPPQKINNELDWHRPILWAWVPVTIIFLIRFASWQPFERSVFWTGSRGRLEHFFYPPASVLSDLLIPSVRIWIFDRYALTGPTLFLLA